MYRLFVVVFAVVFSWSSISAADDVKVIKEDSVEWVCFKPLDAKYLLDMRVQFPLLKEETALQKAQLKLRADELIKLQEGLDNQLEQNKILTQTNIDLQKRLDSSTVWWRNPWLWFGIGVVVGAGLTVGIVIGVKK